MAQSRSIVVPFVKNRPYDANKMFRRTDGIEQPDFDYKSAIYHNMEASQEAMKRAGRPCPPSTLALIARLGGYQTTVPFEGTLIKSVTQAFERDEFPNPDEFLLLTMMTNDGQIALDMQPARRTSMASIVALCNAALTFKNRHTDNAKAFVHQYSAISRIYPAERLAFDKSSIYVIAGSSQEPETESPVFYNSWGLFECGHTHWACKGTECNVLGVQTGPPPRDTFTPPPTPPTDLGPAASYENQPALCYNTNTGQGFTNNHSPIYSEAVWNGRVPHFVPAGNTVGAFQDGHASFQSTSGSVGGLRNNDNTKLVMLKQGFDPVRFNHGKRGVKRPRTNQTYRVTPQPMIPQPAQVNQVRQAQQAQQIRQAQQHQQVQQLEQPRLLQQAQEQFQAQAQAQMKQVQLPVQVQHPQQPAQPQQSQHETLINRGRQPRQSQPQGSLILPVAPVTIPQSAVEEPVVERTAVEVVSFNEILINQPAVDEAAVQESAVQDPLFGEVPSEDDMQAEKNILTLANMMKNEEEKAEPKVFVRPGILDQN